MNEAMDYNPDLGILHGWAGLSSFLLTLADLTWTLWSAVEQYFLSSPVLITLFVSPTETICLNELEAQRLTTLMKVKRGGGWRDSGICVFKEGQRLWSIHLYHVYRWKKKEDWEEAKKRETADRACCWHLKQNGQYMEIIQKALKKLNLDASDHLVKCNRLHYRVCLT